MPQDRRIDYVELPAADLDAAEAFYAAAFGWTFEDYGEGYRAFSDGRLDGGFHRSELRSRASEGAALVILYAEDLEDVERRVTAAGGTIVEPAFSFPGGRRFEFRDPHGNDLAVWTDRPRAS